MVIYKILNLINNKVYIGKTVNTSEARWQQHLYDAYTPAKPAYKFLLSRAIRKYGKDAFKIEDIDIATTEIELNEKEKI